VRVEHRDESLAPLGLVDEVEHIAGAAPEAIQSGDHEFVAGRTKLRMVANSARPSREPPDTFSERMTSQPSAFRRAT
jgi:hypothetical protein